MAPLQGLRLVGIPEEVEKPCRGLARQRGEKQGNQSRGRACGLETEDTHHKLPSDCLSFVG
jgi:hypothetical protein